MESKTVDKILAVVGIFIVIALIIAFFKKVNKNTETKIISEDALAALQDPDKKKLIDDAINESIENQKETGVWNDPVVNLN